MGGRACSTKYKGNLKAVAIKTGGRYKKRPERENERKYPETDPHKYGRWIL